MEASTSRSARLARTIQAGASHSKPNARRTIQNARWSTTGSNVSANVAAAPSVKPVPTLPPIASASYSFNKSTATSLNAAQKRSTALLESFFRDSLISAPIYRGSNTEMTISLFYFHEQRGQPYSQQALLDLSDAISELYPSGTRIALRPIRIHQPYQNAQILARYLALNGNRHGFNRMQNTLLNVVPFVRADLTNAPLPSHITGIKVQLSGLLTTQRQAPRKTVSSAQAGTFHGVNVKTDYGMSENKSRLGAFCVKVWISSATSWAGQVTGAKTMGS